jgi:hypothetical protein
MLRVLGSLRGLRVQLLLWTVLPLTIALVAVAVLGISTHQRSMRELVEELDARSARLAAAHLSDGLTERVALLEVLADRSERFTSIDALDTLFDGGLARLDASGKFVDASPSLEAWLTRPVSELIEKGQLGQPAFSSLFADSLSGRNSLLVAWTSEAGEVVTGAVSVERLGLAEAMAQAQAEGFNDPGFEGTEPGPEPRQVVAFLVDADGQIIYHPDPTQVGQDLREHEGVMSVIQGQDGATYHREPDGRELVVGYAPVVRPGWGLIVQEPWESLIAPMMRLSLMAPLAVVVAALVSGLAVTLGLRYVVRPLQALDRQAMHLAWGDFSAASEPVGGCRKSRICGGHWKGWPIKFRATSRGCETISPP